MNFKMLGGRKINLPPSPAPIMDIELMAIVIRRFIAIFIVSHRKNIQLIYQQLTVIDDSHIKAEAQSMILQTMKFLL